MGDPSNLMSAAETMDMSVQRPEDVYATIKQLRASLKTGAVNDMRQWLQDWTKAKQSLLSQSQGDTCSVPVAQNRRPASNTERREAVVLVDNFAQMCNIKNTNSRSLKHITSARRTLENKLERIKQREEIIARIKQRISAIVRDDQYKCEESDYSSSDVEDALASSSASPSSQAGIKRVAEGITLCTLPGSPKWDHCGYENTDCQPDGSWAEEKSQKFQFNLTSLLRPALLKGRRQSVRGRPQQSITKLEILVDAKRKACCYSC